MLVPMHGRGSAPTSTPLPTSPQQLFNDSPALNGDPLLPHAAIMRAALIAR